MTKVTRQGTLLCLVCDAVLIVWLLQQHTTEAAYIYAVVLFCRAGLLIMVRKTTNDGLLLWSPFMAFSW